MKISLTQNNLSHQASRLFGEVSFKVYAICGLCIACALGSFDISNAYGDQPKTEPKSEPSKNVEEAPAVDASEAPSDGIDVILDPMKMRFKISKIERGLSRDSRRFDAPRIVTLSTLGAIGHLDESVWPGKKLAVFHKVPIQIGNGMVAYNRVKVGEVKVKSVYQSTLQAQVIKDDLTKGLSSRKGRLGVGEARVVMLGDTAQLQKAIVAPRKVKKRKVYKPKTRKRYERKEMKWRL
jgi:hypothetical protein